MFLVKSAQVPCTPSTLAWPPNIPCVPTSNATLVTSEAKADNWSTIKLTVSTNTILKIVHNPFKTSTFQCWHFTPDGYLDLLGQITPSYGGRDNCNGSYLIGKRGTRPIDLWNSWRPSCKRLSCRYLRSEPTQTIPLLRPVYALDLPVCPDFLLPKWPEWLQPQALVI